MGLIKAVAGSIGGQLADQWKEYFYCESMPEDVLVSKGQKRVKGKFGTKNKGNDNLISNGSVVAVNEGQCMIIVDQGAIVEFCADPGEFLYDTSSEPSLFCGKLGDSLKQTFANIGKRITFGGDTGRDQRVYFFNTKENMNNLFGTPNPVPFRVVDTNIGLDMDMSVRCNGSYSFRIIDPLLFYKNVSGNVERDYTKDQMSGQLKSELLTALQPAFARISEMGIRYSAVPAHTKELADALNAELSNKWGEIRGIRIVSFGVNSIKLSDEDEQTIKDLQKSNVLGNARMAAGTLVGAQAEAMKAAASNQNAGPMMAFAGMNMASQAGGINAGSLFAMDAANQQNAGQQAAPSQTGSMHSGAKKAGGWKCSCGYEGNIGKFCQECGSQRPEPSVGWTCSCGAVNEGKFCQECGKKKPEGAPLYKCDKCGWTPEDPAHPPKFCPECGDVFDENDIQ